MRDLQSLPTLKGGRVRLRPLIPDDYKTLFGWHADLSSLHLGWSDRQILSFEEFMGDLHRRLTRLVQVLFIVETASGEGPTPIGMVYTYGTNLIERYTCASTLLLSTRHAG